MNSDGSHLVDQAFHKLISTRQQLYLLYLLLPVFGTVPGTADMYQGYARLLGMELFLPGSLWCLLVDRMTLWNEQ